MMPHSVQLTEILWTLGGIPGWIIWFLHGRYAHSVYQVTIRSGEREDIVWAKMTLFLTIMSILVETSAISIGVFGMTQEPVNTRISPLGWAVTGHILLVSLGVLLVGIAWAYAMRTLRSSAAQALRKRP